MNNIVDPLTNELHSIFSNHGTYLLKKYVTLLQNGGGKTKQGGNPKGRGGKGKTHGKSKKTNPTHSRKNTQTIQKEEKLKRKQTNVFTKKLDQAQRKKKEKLELFLRPVREFISESPKSDDFENNVIEPIIETAFMSQEEIDKYLIEKQQADKNYAFIVFREKLKNSGAWIGMTTPLTMAQTAVTSKSKSFFVRVLLFVTAIILATNTIIGYVPLATKVTELVVDNYRKGRAESTHVNLRGATHKPFEYNSYIPTETTKYDNMQWDFNDESQWGSFGNIGDEELRNSIAGLSGRPGLLYDTRNLEFVMKAWQESPAPSTPSYPGTPEGEIPEETQ